MKPEILEILIQGEKTEEELTHFFGADNCVEMKDSLAQMQDWGLVESFTRQVHEGNNVIRWDHLYRLRALTSEAA